MKYTLFAAILLASGAAHAAECPAGEVTNRANGQCVTYQQLIDVAYELVRDVPRTMPLTQYADVVETALRREFQVPTCGPNRLAPATSGLATATCAVGVGMNALDNYTTGDDTFAIGPWSGADLIEGSRDLLIGACTATPTPYTSGFVDIDIPGLHICFWRDDGVRMDCPITPCKVPVS